MKSTALRNSAFVTLVCALGVAAHGQTLFVPSGTSGIGTSSTGYVGIGTAGPARPLSVAGYNSSVQLRLERTNNSTGLADLGADECGFKIYPGGYPSTGKVFAIDMNGNVGIGTNTPATRLHIQPPSGGGNVVFRLSTNSAADGTVAALDFHMTSNQAFTGGARVSALRTGANAECDFRVSTTDSAGSLSEQMRVTSIGNVGIGTTAPTHKLSVAGTIKAKEVIVETTGWSDYVFADDYRLAPLSEVEAHIKSERRLPGIPSEQQVAEHGVSVGEMQAALLAKVEELTLYTIAQNQKLAEAMARIEKQEQQIHRMRLLLAPEQ